MRNSILVRLIIILAALCLVPMYLTYTHRSQQHSSESRRYSDEIIIVKTQQAPLPTTTTTTATTTPIPTTTTPPECPDESPLTKGPVNIVYTRPSNITVGNWPPTLEETARKYMGLQLGGYYPGPDDCIVPKHHNIAIIIPFRGRHEHLKYQLHFLHGILQRQQMRYVVIVAEQDDDEPFNKAQLMNTAFKYVVDTYPDVFDCVAFHDVDTLCEDDRALYRCDTNGNNVVHLAHRIDKFDYKFCCGVTVGGVLLMKKEQFEKINGFSNQYFGWGAEDDDANARVEQGGKFTIVRPQPEYYRFKMIKHKPDANNEPEMRRFDMLKKWQQRMMVDGLNSLDTTINNVVYYFTHTRLLIKPSTLRMSASMEAERKVEAESLSEPEIASDWAQRPLDKVFDFFFTE